jgi:hypothetical protein
VKQLLKRFVPVIVAVASSVAGLVLSASPASAERVPTSMEFVRWMATFNTNGPQTGFVRSSAFDGIPPTLQTC